MVLWNKCSFESLPMCCKSHFSVCTRTAGKKASEINPALPAAAVASAPDNETRTFPELRSVLWEFSPAWDGSWKLGSATAQCTLDYSKRLFTGQTIPALQHEREKMQGQAITQTRTRLPWAGMTQEGDKASSWHHRVPKL